MYKVYLGSNRFIKEIEVRNVTGSTMELKHYYSKDFVFETRTLQDNLIFVTLNEAADCLIEIQLKTVSQRYKEYEQEKELLEHLTQKYKIDGDVSWKCTKFI